MSCDIAPDLIFAEKDGGEVSERGCPWESHILPWQWHKVSSLSPSSSSSSSSLWFFRFMGLFRKGVPHGRAVVIAEDGSQVKVCNIAFLSSFREAGKKRLWKSGQADRLGWPPVFLWRLPLLLFSCFSIYYFFLLRFGKARSTEANRKHKILSLNSTQR